MNLTALLNLPPLRASHERVVSAMRMITAISMAGLVIIELVGSVLAFGWAMAGMLAMPTAMAIAGALLLALPLAWVSAWLSILAFNAETDPEN